MYKDRTTLKPQRKKTTTQKIVTVIMKNETKESAVVEPVSSQKVSTFSQETKTEKAINDTDTTESDGTSQAKVDIPQNVIYMLLIGESFLLKSTKFIFGNTKTNRFFFFGLMAF